MNRRPLPAVAVAVLVLLAGVGPVASVGPDAERTAALAVAGHTDAFDVHTADAVHADDAAEAIHADDATRNRSGKTHSQYKVSIENVTIETWLLRNATVVNATVENVVVRNATTPNGSRANVTLSNVTVGRFALERARLESVTAETLVVRNRSILSVPGGSLIDPNVQNRTIERHWTRNQTVSGVVIDRLVVNAAILCGNATLGQQAVDAVSFDPTASEDEPDISVRNGSVREALVMRGEATNWSAASVRQPESTDASLPSGCDRG